MLFQLCREDHPLLRIVTVTINGAEDASVIGGAFAGNVADLVDLLEHLGHSRATLCGFSHGARVAFETAAAHPERVDRLIQ